MTDPTSPISVPRDLAACRALIEQLTLTVAELQEREAASRQKIQELELTLAELLQRAFQKRSERYLAHPDQLRIDFGDADQAADAAAGLARAIAESDCQQPDTEVAAHRRKCRSKRREESLPEHLERYEVEAPAPADLRRCDRHGERTLIGYDRVETLEFERPRLRVRVTKVSAQQNQD